jgi:small membrane protein
MIIRVVILSALAAIGYLGFVRRNRLPVHIVLVFAILAVAALAVVFPEKTSIVAAWVGVGRGVDLIGYLVQVSLLFISLHYYTKFVEVQHQITGVVRELALLRAELESRGHPTSSADDATR